MTKPKIIYGRAILFSIAVFLLTPKPVSAQTLVPGALPIEGLSLDYPLALMNNQAEGIKILSYIQEGPKPVLYINPKPKSDSVADLIADPPKPVETPTPAESPISKPKVIEIPSSISTPTPAPTPTASVTPQVSFPGGLDANKLFSMVNQFRASINLPAFQTDPKVCTLAQARAPQVGEEIADGVMHRGLAAFNFPYWNTENIISMRTNEEAFNWWIHDEIHKEAIEGPYKYSCLACSGSSCAEEFTNLEPK